jgi:acyl-CoA thioesterase
MASSTAQAAVNALYDDDRASQALGIEILDVEPGRVRVAMAIRPDMTNGHGICHGGVLFTLADSAFAFACNSRGDPMVAAGASIEYLVSARAGERVIAAAVEISRSERHGIYDVAITTASGETIAQFRGRCARLRTT